MSGQVNAGAGQIQTLCTTIETMDRLAQVGLNEIEAIGWVRRGESRRCAVTGRMCATWWPVEGGGAGEE